MLKSYLALFQDQRDAEGALHELTQKGYSPENIKLFSLIGNLRGGYQQATIGTNPDDRYADMKSELFRNLRDWGVPKEDAFLFTELVRRGEKLIIVFAESKESQKITDILDSHGAVDLNLRKMYSEDLRRNPTDGISESPFTKISQDSTFEEDLIKWRQAHQDEIRTEIKVRDFELPKSCDDKHLERNLNE